MVVIILVLSMFEGGVEDFRIYKRRLSFSEVQELSTLSEVGPECTMFMRSEWWQLLAGSSRRQQALAYNEMNGYVQGTLTPFLVGKYMYAAR